MANLSSFTFACPRCLSPLDQTSADEMCCPTDGLHFRHVDGVWRMLLPERAPHFAQFMREYESVRRAEGRGEGRPDYYRALPFHDLSGRMPGDWQIRRASFEALIERVVTPFERQLARPLRNLRISVRRHDDARESRAGVDVHAGGGVPRAAGGGEGEAARLKTPGREDKPLAITFRGGEYHLAKTVELTAQDSGIVFRSTPGEKARFTATCSEW